MKISTRSRYGLRLMLDLAEHHGEGPIFLKDIARRQDISVKYLSQIIMPLKARGLVNSFRGAHGGYVLPRLPEAITLREIVEALEGELELVACVSDTSQCKRSEICATQGVWRKVGAAVAATLEGMTLADLVHEQRTRAGGGLAWSI
jgi:Rrf2 family protein